MEKQKDRTKENITEYLRQQNISWKQIKKDTGINMENFDMFIPEEFFSLCRYLRRKPEYFTDPVFQKEKEMEEIRAIFYKYQRLFDTIDAKVAFTLENEAYFFRYNKEDDSYEMNTRLENAEQLERIAERFAGN